MSGGVRVKCICQMTLTFGSSLFDSLYSHSPTRAPGESKRCQARKLCDKS